MKVGVVIGRFHAPYLHKGHEFVLDKVNDYNDVMLVFVGVKPGQPTSKDPLPFEARKHMIYEKYPNAIIIPLYDTKSDDAWCKNIDSEIANYIDITKSDITLYGSRDSFLKMYSGKHKTEYIDEIPNINATDIREDCRASIKNSEDFRRGVIHGIANRFSTSYQTVDIAVWNKDKNEFLLAKKPFENNYRFVGGFVDVTDESLEQAAKREATEECGGIETDAYKYLGSFRIDDWRYRKSVDGIMTAFFLCQYIFGRPQATDDISELVSMPFDKMSVDIFEPEHQELAEKLINYIKNEIK